ncbi:MAG: (Fe-S)-binding protein [Proteobacteria bacterium]|jgi:Fe-S oxidoreductase|nr:(Fe-S)-binding protein [Pseudomonadota bacterium]
MVLEDYKDIIHRCFRCGNCKFSSDYSGYNCPAYNKFRMETYSPGGRLWLIRAMMNGEIEVTPSLAKVLYTCTMCFNCVEECSFEFSEEIMNMMIAARTHIIEKPVIPAGVRDYLKNVYNYGNPWKEPERERGDWANGTEIDNYKQGDEYLYYVGDICSYDPRGRKIARSLGEVLLRAGVSLGILGADEYSDGNDVHKMGEDGLFQYLAEKNIQSFKEKGVKRVITLSPHAYNAMKNDYPKVGGDFEVLHYTQLLRDLIANGKLKIPKSLDIKVTYHDPCFLGRWNKEYDAPREVLKAIPGVELVEMDRNRKTAFCCGGGGGNFFTDLVGGGKESPSRTRIREAYATGAKVLAVACPACLTMLEDALKTEHLEGKFEVKDISEIVGDAFNPTLAKISTLLS